LAKFLAERLSFYYLLQPIPVAKKNSADKTSSIVNEENNPMYASTEASIKPLNIGPSA
jgi:hypothetical protein